MESNAVDVYAAKERLRRDIRLLDAYAAGAPVCGIAKQMGWRLRCSCGRF